MKYKLTTQTTLSEIELLKIGLLTCGMNVSETARRFIEGDEKRPLTLADYASTSGISMELEGNVWVNVLFNNIIQILLEKHHIL